MLVVDEGVILVVIYIYKQAVATHKGAFARGIDVGRVEHHGMVGARIHGVFHEYGLQRLAVVERLVGYLHAKPLIGFYPRVAVGKGECLDGRPVEGSHANLSGGIAAVTPYVVEYDEVLCLPVADVLGDMGDINRVVIVAGDGKAVALAVGQDGIAQSAHVIVVGTLVVFHQPVGILRPVRVGEKLLLRALADADDDLTVFVEEVLGGDNLAWGEIDYRVCPRIFAIAQVYHAQVGAPLECPFFYDELQVIVGLARGVDVAEGEAAQVGVVSECPGVYQHGAVFIGCADVGVECHRTAIACQIVGTDVGHVGVEGARVALAVDAAAHHLARQTDKVVGVLHQSGTQDGVVPCGLAVQFIHRERTARSVGGEGTVRQSVGDILFALLTPRHDAVGILAPSRVGLERLHLVGPYADEGIGATLKHGVVGGIYLRRGELFVFTRGGVAIYEVDVLQSRTVGKCPAAYLHAERGIHRTALGVEEAHDAQLRPVAIGFCPNLGGTVGIGGAGVVVDGGYAIVRTAEV